MSNFEHAGNFHLNNTLAFAISDIITKQENKDKNEKTDYACFIIDAFKKDASYLAIMDTTAKKYFDKINFVDEKHFNATLDSLSLYNSEYSGILNVNACNMTEKFPYLNPFFNELDKTRELSGRITLNTDEINDAYVKTLDRLDLIADSCCME